MEIPSTSTHVGSYIQIHYNNNDIMEIGLKTGLCKNLQNQDLTFEQFKSPFRRDQGLCPSLKVKVQVEVDSASAHLALERALLHAKKKKKKI